MPSLAQRTIQRTMHLHAAFRLPATLALLALLTSGHLSPAEAQPAMPPAPGNARHAGEITLRVDATDLDHKILRVQQTLPVRPGPLTLYFPRWLPGTHSPSNDIGAMAGLQFSSGGKPVAGRATRWTRMPSA